MRGKKALSFIGWTVAAGVFTLSILLAWKAYLSPDFVLAYDALLQFCREMY